LIGIGKAGPSVRAPSLFRQLARNVGPQGLYFWTTTDLVHWTKPTLVVTQEELLSHDPVGSFYAYFSVLDPHAPERYFPIVGKHAYLYQTSLSVSNSDRVLLRQPIKLKLTP
jgi:hypothetical protein